MKESTYKVSQSYSITPQNVDEIRRIKIEKLVNEKKNYSNSAIVNDIISDYFKYQELIEYLKTVLQQKEISFEDFIQGSSQYIKTLQQ